MGVEPSVAFCQSRPEIGALLVAGGEQAGSMELVALAVSDDAARDAVEARVLARGGAIEGRTGYTIYFRDPEGRRLGVSTYPLEPTR